MTTATSNGASLVPQALPVALRFAWPDERHLVDVLAELDEAPVLDGPVMLAMIDDRAVAALSLLDGRVVADPFIRTTEAVALLRLRAEQLSVATHRGRLPALLRPLRLIA